MASASETLLRIQGEKSPLIGLLEGLAGGISSAQQNQYVRAKAILDLQQQREQQQRMEEQDRMLRQQIEQQTKNNLNATGTPQPVLPAQKLEMGITTNDKGYLTPKWETVKPKAASYSAEKYKDAKGVVRIGTMNSATGEIVRKPTDPEAPTTASPTEQPKMLPANTVLALNEGKNVARLLPDVESAIKKNLGKYGPVTGRISTANPYNTNAQTFEARMKTASQAFGRFMEGGVLRKEDEIKYVKMFPQASDKDEVKINKLAIIRRTLAQKYEDDRKTLGASGYDVSGFEELSIPESVFEEKATENETPGDGAGSSGSGWTSADESRYQELLKKQGAKQ